MQTGNYPFTTIEPNVGVAYIRVPCVCKALGVTDSPVNSSCVDGSRLIPVKLIDVAGLVPKASEGKGLGNKFLDDLTQADALIHVVDASGSTDKEGRNLRPGSHDPIEDIEFVEKEFDLWLRQILSKEWSRISKVSAGESKPLPEMLAERLSGISISEPEIMEALRITGLDTAKPAAWNDEEFLRFCSVLRKISKPTIIAANKSDLPVSKENLERLSKIGRTVRPCAAEAELLLRRASQSGLITYVPGDRSFSSPDRSKLSDPQEKALKVVEERVLNVYGSTGVQEVINSAFLELLGGVVVYPVEDEHKFSDKKQRILPDAYVMERGSTARDLAYTIHSDLGRTFLYAIDARKGVRLGADYELRDSDVIKIVATGRGS